MFALAAGFALFSVTAAPYVGPRRYNRAKLDAYECGIEPSPHPVVGAGRMPVAYYLTAMLFILFDIEMVFLYPFAVSANALVNRWKGRRPNGASARRRQSRPCSRSIKTSSALPRCWCRLAHQPAGRTG